MYIEEDWCLACVPMVNDSKHNKRMWHSVLQQYRNLCKYITYAQCAIMHVYAHAQTDGWSGWERRWWCWTEPGRRQRDHTKRITIGRKFRWINGNSAGRPQSLWGCLRRPPVEVTLVCRHYHPQLHSIELLAVFLCCWMAEGHHLHVNSTWQTSNKPFIMCRC